jgi:hypothetical protein
MKDEHFDIADALDPARFVRQHSKLDRALCTQLKPPLLSARFRSQVWQRIATERSAMVRTAPSPTAAWLRARFAFQCANMGATGIAAALACWAVWPALSRVLTVSDSAGVTVMMIISGSILLIGLNRLDLFRAL